MALIPIAVESFRQIVLSIPAFTGGLLSVTTTSSVSLHPLPLKGITSTCIIVPNGGAGVKTGFCPVPSTVV
jgi:hypothetical protein